MIFDIFFPWSVPLNWYFYYTIFSFATFSIVIISGIPKWDDLSCQGRSKTLCILLLLYWTLHDWPIRFLNMVTDHIPGLSLKHQIMKRECSGRFNFLFPMLLMRLSFIFSLLSLWNKDIDTGCVRNMCCVSSVDSCCKILWSKYGERRGNITWSRANFEIVF